MTRVAAPPLLLLLASTPATPAHRVPWDTSRIPRRSDAPPAYPTESVFPGPKFDHPFTIVRGPGTKRLLVAELMGKVFTFPDDPQASRPVLLLDLGQVPGHWRTYGVAFHPDFA